MPTPSSDRPQFVHDCESCIYCGSTALVEDEGGGSSHTRDGRAVPPTVVDLYYCPSSASPSLASLLARYGDEGHQYISSHPPAAFSGSFPDRWVLQKRWRSVRVRLPQKWEAQLISRARELGVYVETWKRYQPNKLAAPLRHTWPFAAAGLLCTIATKTRHSLYKHACASFVRTTWGE